MAASSLAGVDVEVIETGVPKYRPLKFTTWCISTLRGLCNIMAVDTCRVGLELICNYRF